MENQKYNGWTNFETWQAALWLGNVLDSIKDDNGKITHDDVVAVLDCMTYEQAAEGRLECGLIGDILDRWHAFVNVQEIADRHNEG